MRSGRRNNIFAVAIRRFRPALRKVRLRGQRTIPPARSRQHWEFPLPRLNQG